ncbi:hypothetical protein [Paenimyroides aestuarii]|uniref:Uncharacterized protein n=1 Tax=Paenimyroides aestuarii TaxID=2968490 RepID=A0ABY5NSP1_9FLAO|nr:hypothetical protein [Paenimyroides aestuarii]UUV21590.1 hypothetical protein NPX36_00595 [Paenimyroides aestuarii]
MGIMIEENLKIKPSICDELKEDILFLNNEEKQVIVHCSIYSVDYGDAARIWKSTYLVDKESGLTYKLIFAEGISFAPQWTLIPFQKPLEFTLIFKGLPKSCKSFDLVEIIPEDGGFQVLNISRNTADVYYVTI